MAEIGNTWQSGSWVNGQVWATGAWADGAWVEGEVWTDSAWDRWVNGSWGTLGWGEGGWGEGTWADIPSTPTPQPRPKYRDGTTVGGGEYEKWWKDHQRGLRKKRILKEDDELMELAAIIVASGILD